MDSLHVVQLATGALDKIRRQIWNEARLAGQIYGPTGRGPKAAVHMLDDWLPWGRRCRLAPFVKLARTIAQTSTSERSGIPVHKKHPPRAEMAATGAIAARVRVGPKVRKRSRSSLFGTPALSAGQFHRGFHGSSSVG